jgi:hypothetical protein
MDSLLAVKEIVYVRTQEVVSDSIRSRFKSGEVNDLSRPLVSLTPAVATAVAAAALLITTSSAVIA